jgi:hypothetical protein
MREARDAGDMIKEKWGMTVGRGRDSRKGRRLLIKGSGGLGKSIIVKIDLNRGQQGRNRSVEERLQRSLFGRG